MRSVPRRSKMAPFRAIGMAKRSAPKTRTLVLLLAASLAPISTAPAQDDSSAPARTPVEEKVDVNLVEIEILALDKKGRPITDLKADEVKVTIGRKKQKIAFLEPLADQEHDARWARSAPHPATLYATENDKVFSTRKIAGAKVIPPAKVLQQAVPKPQRRIVLVFDPKSSRRDSRRVWREAALQWIETQMQDDDRVAVALLKAYPEWQTGFTSERDALRRAVSTMELYEGFPSRSRRNEVVSMVASLRGMCEVDSIGGQNRSNQTTEPADVACAVRILQPTVHQWWTESKETVDALAVLVGELAAVPGRKNLLYFSEGILPDAAVQATVIAQTSLDTQSTSFSQWASWLDRNVLRELLHLQSVAEGANVAFFPFDTRHRGARSSEAASLEFGNQLRRSSLGVDPWAEMYDATQGTLKAIASETAGKFFSGKRDLAKKLEAAVGTYRGAYVLGYYRDKKLRLGAKRKIKIGRRGLRLTFPGKVQVRRTMEKQTRLELRLGPSKQVTDQLVQIPLQLEIPSLDLPLRRGSGGYGTQLGVFVQAVKADGEIAGEWFSAQVPLLTREEYVTRAKTDHRLHLDVALNLPPGLYRLRVRVTDEGLFTLGDRIVEIQVSPDGLAPARAADAAKET